MIIKQLYINRRLTGGWVPIQLCSNARNVKAWWNADLSPTKERTHCIKPDRAEITSPHLGYQSGWGANNSSDIPPSAHSSQSTKRFTKTTWALIFSNIILIRYVSIENESDCYWISYSSEPIDLKKSKPFILNKCLWIGIIGSCSYTLHCVGIWRDIQYVYSGQFANKNRPWCKKIDILISYNDILNH